MERLKRIFSADFIISAVIGIIIGWVIIASANADERAAALQTRYLGNVDGGRVTRFVDDQYNTVCYVHFRGVACVKK